MFTTLNYQTMPKTGDVYRYGRTDKTYSLVTVIGIAFNIVHEIDVVFTDYDWSLAQLPIIHTLPLQEFLRIVEIPANYPGGRPNLEYMFMLQPDRVDTRCPYIRPAQPPQTVEQRFVNALSKIDAITSVPRQDRYANELAVEIRNITNAALNPTAHTPDKPVDTVNIPKRYSFDIPPGKD